MNREKFVTDVGAQLGEGQTQCRPALDQYEWLGLCRGLETRISWDESDWKSVVKLAHSHRPFTLNHEPGASPQPGGPAASSEDDVIRVFVAKEVFFETFGWTLDDEIRGYHGMPTELAQHITTAMACDRVGGWALVKAQMEAKFLDPAGDRDPLASVVRFTQLMAWTAEHLQRLSPRSAAQNASLFPQGEPTRLTCGHCSAIFLLSATTARCPNCGAPATA